MSMLDEDEEYEDDVLYERRGTPFLRSARPELVVPTSSTIWLWPGAPNSWLWPRACAATGKGASEAVRFRCGGWSLRGRVASHTSPQFHLPSANSDPHTQHRNASLKLEIDHLDIGERDCYVCLLVVGPSYVVWKAYVHVHC